MNDIAQRGFQAQGQPGVAPAPATLGGALRASTRTHLVLLRFGIISLGSAAVDNLIFYVVFHATGSIAGAQVVARTVSVFFNYHFVRRAVFFSGHAHKILLSRYLLLVCVNALISYAGIRLLSANTSLGVVRSKILTETLLFAANFVVQRTFIFRRRKPSASL